MKIRSVEVSSTELAAVCTLGDAYRADIVRPKPAHPWAVSKQDAKRVPHFKRLPADHPLDLAVHGDTLAALGRFLGNNVGEEDEMLRLGLSLDQWESLLGLANGLERIDQEIEAA